MTKRRVISVWLPRLATDRLRREKSGASRVKPQSRKGSQAREGRGARESRGSRERPLTVVHDSGGRTLVGAVNEAAAEVGLFQGMTLADARTHVPSLDTEPADPLADASLLERTVRWCGRYTPWTAVDGLDGVWLDTTGCAHLFGGEQAMLDDLVVRLERLGFGVRAALADTPGAAWAVARYGVNGSVVARGGAALGPCLSANRGAAPQRWHGGRSVAPRLAQRRRSL